MIFSSSLSSFDAQRTKVGGKLIKENKEDEARTVLEEMLKTTLGMTKRGYGWHPLPPIAKSARIVTKKL